MTTAMTFENLSKRYGLGHEVKRATSAREAITNAALSPFRYLKYRLSPMTEEDTLWALKDISFEVKEGEVYPQHSLGLEYSGGGRRLMSDQRPTPSSLVATVDEETACDDVQAAAEIVQACADYLAKWAVKETDAPDDERQ